jgi:hypothetical protein
VVLLSALPAATAASPAAPAAPAAPAVPAVRLAAGAPDGGAADAGAAARSDGAGPPGSDAGDAREAGADGGTADAGGVLGDARGGDVDAAATAAEQRQQPPPPPPPVTPAAPPAARHTVTGVVRAKGTRRPLAGATLFVDGLPAAETDDAGAFTLLLTPGRHRIAAHAPLHELTEIETDVETDAGAAPTPGALLFSLMPQVGAESYGAVVRAPPDGPPRLTLAPEEMRKTPGSFGDPLRVLESLPGVSQVIWPLAIYAVRGANPGNTGFFLDGVRMPTLFHFLLGPSVIHPYFIDRLDFFPGAYPIRYGRFVSGIVAAETAAPPADRLHLEVDVRLFDAGALAAAPFHDGKGAVAAAARFSYTGLLFSMLSNDVDLFYADYQLRVEHRLAGGKAILLAMGSFDSLRISPDLGQRRAGDGDLQFHRVTLRWTGPLAGGRLDASVTGGTDHTRTTVLDSPLDVSAASLMPRVELVRPFAAGRVVLQLGGDGDLQRFHPRPPPDLPSPGDFTRTRGAAAMGLYAGLTLRLGDRVAVTPAVRLDRFWEQAVTRNELGPRLIIRTALSPRLALTASGGRFSQMPSFPLSNGALESFDLRTLGPQRSWQGSLAAEARLAPALELVATTFLQRFRLSDLASHNSVDPQRQSLEMRNGRGYGLELMLRLPSERRLSGWVAYTLSKSERDFGGSIGPSDWDQRHILNVVGRWRIDRAWSVGGRFHYATGRPFPVTVTGNVEYQRLPAFYQLDLRIDRRFVFDRFILDAYLEVVNATLTRQVVEIRTNFDNELERTGFRVILPSIGLHASF